MRPRWRKVLADLRGNLGRTMLVIASIAVGLFAFGVIATMYIVIREDMSAGYAAVKPANIQLRAINKTNQHRPEGFFLLFLG